LKLLETDREEKRERERDSQDSGFHREAVNVG